ncbi:hypothetical protein NX772_01530 [Mesomycoplasma molare]|uniref:Uncharacterized protein n=2 Tax=Mesomycoplasma molare TaxID=171288 RepID=A0ABY5TZN3_9BACT|nr:hypothetical protein [Mesomycoplasma molare]UWD34494.1 hypothetical protein NX772_01530 [Mesomycoplasma molare]
MDKSDIKSIVIEKTSTSGVTIRYTYKFRADNIDTWATNLFNIFKKIELGATEQNYVENETKYLFLVHNFLDKLESPKPKLDNYRFNYQYLDNKSFSIKGIYNTASLKINPGDVLKVKTPSFKNLDEIFYGLFEESLLNSDTYTPSIKENDESFTNQVQDVINNHKHKFIYYKETSAGMIEKLVEEGNKEVIERLIETVENRDDFNKYILSSNFFKLESFKKFLKNDLKKDDESYSRCESLLDKMVEIKKLKNQNGTPNYIKRHQYKNEFDIKTNQEVVFSFIKSHIGVSELKDMLNLEKELKQESEEDFGMTM